MKNRKEGNDEAYKVQLSLLTMTTLNHMREMLLFVCSKMADQTNSCSKVSVADGTKEVRARQLCW